MRNRALASLLLTSALVACSSDGGPGEPTAHTLKNDAFPADVAGFQAGFAAAEAAAAIFPARGSDYAVRHIHFLFGGGGTSKTITLTLYADTGGVNPGAPLFSADYEVTPSNDAMQEIDLAADSVLVSAGDGLRVAIFFQHDGVPSVAVDEAIGDDRNAIYTTAGWAFSETLALTGDFIIRAEILQE